MKNRWIAAATACLMLCLLFVNGRIPVEAANKNRVVIQSYSVSNDDVAPGDKFDLTVRIKNTSATQAAESVLLTFDSSSEGIYPVYGESNQQYIDRLEPNQEMDVVMHLQAASTLEAYNVDYHVNIAYGEGNRDLQNEAVIQIPIGQESSLMVLSYSVADNTTVGAKTRISVNYKNVGLEELNDVVMHVNVDGMTEQKSEIGNIAAGEENNKETYFSFAKPGEQEVTIFLTYKDTTGTQCYTQNISAKVEVTESDSLGGDSTLLLGTDESSGLHLQAWQVLVILAIIVVSGIIIVLIRKDREK